MKFLNKKTIKLDKEINELDRFVFKFLNVLEKHADYVLISGYVAILFGRSRATEDVDIFINEISEERFTALYEDLKKEGYWCLNGESAGGLYEYLAEGVALRFAVENEIVPNFEVKFAKKKLDREVFNDDLTIIVADNKIKISSLERQIAYKKYYLKSGKDLEDAAHLEKIFKGNLDIKKIAYYQELLQNEISQTRKKQ